MIYVYFISSGKGKKAPIKIGVSKNIDKRIDELQTGNPNKLHLLSAIECTSIKRAYNLEGYLHHKLRRFRLVGEWFRREDWNLPSILSVYEGRIKEEAGTFRRLKGHDIKKELIKENRELKERVKKLEDDIEEYLDEISNVSNDPYKLNLTSKE